MAQSLLPAPRHCHIVKWESYDGFGFNLYQEKSRPGQFIGKVEPGSPAAVAGLKEDDKIVEVNGVNIARENHKQVVGRIKAIGSETTLLVVDKECEDYHREQGVVIKCSLPYVEHLSSQGYTSEDEEYIDTNLQTVSYVDEANEVEESEVKDKYVEHKRKGEMNPVFRHDSGVSDGATSD